MTKKIKYKKITEWDEEGIYFIKVTILCTIIGWLCFLLGRADYLTRNPIEIMFIMSGFAVIIIIAGLMLCKESYWVRK